MAEHGVVEGTRSGKGQNECGKTVRDEADIALGMTHGLVAQVTMRSSSLSGAMRSHATDCTDERAMMTQSRASRTRRSAEGGRKYAKEGARSLPT